MFLLTVFITTMTILLLLLAVVLYNINPPKAIEVTKKRTPGKAQVALSGDTDGDGVLSEEEIRVQLEGVAAICAHGLSTLYGAGRRAKLPRGKRCAPLSMWLFVSERFMQCQHLHR